MKGFKEFTQEIVESKIELDGIGKDKVFLKQLKDSGVTAMIKSDDLIIVDSKKAKEVKALLKDNGYSDKAVVESKATQKVVKEFWGAAAGLMRLLDGDELKQFKSALGGIDNILSMTDLREEYSVEEGYSRTGSIASQLQARVSKLKILKEKGSLKATQIKKVEDDVIKAHKDRLITSPEFDELEADLGRLY